MNKLILITVLLALGFSSKGQEILREVQSNGGITNSSGNVTLSSTIGEPIDISLTDGNIWLIQGFEQPLKDTAIATFIYQNINVEVAIYPNPTYGPLNIDLDISQFDDLNLFIDVFNIEGKSLMMQKMSNQNYQIDLSHLPAATYLLRISDEENTIQQTVKIQKLN